MPNKKIGLIGCGTIGIQLAKAIDTQKVDNASLVSLFDIIESNTKSLRLALKSNPDIYSDFEEFISSNIDIVVEAASQYAVGKFCSEILQAGKDVMIMSVGALADENLFSDLAQIASKKGCKIYIPTGAIAGIDAIRSVKSLLESVTLTTTKNPKALEDAPFFETSNIRIQNLKEKTIIYEGSAADAVKAFPANVNVAAVLSLAGIGFNNTKVRIVADPAITTNQHEIHGAGSFGEIRVTVNNVPSPRNPKTSFLAVLSAVECLRSICDGEIRIGT